MKKIGSILLLFILVSCISNNSKKEFQEKINSKEKDVSFAIKDSTNTSKNIEEEKAMSNAALQYLDLIPKLKAYHRKKGGKGKYPEFYGGSYVSEHKKYMVMVKGDVNYYRKILDSLTSTTNYSIKSCSYSYNELEKAMDEMSKKFRIIKNPNFHTMALDEMNNVILIGLDKLNDENIEQFKRDIGDYPFLKFEKSDPVLEE